MSAPFLNWMRLRPSAGHAALLTMALAPACASAHTGDHSAGLLHPWTGLDHIAAMLAVGAWSSATAVHWWRLPLAFVIALLVGAGVSLSGLAVPYVEAVITASVLVFGLLATACLSVHKALALPLVSAFAFFHGAAHGSEIAGQADALRLLLGLLVSSIGLQALGAGVVRAAGRHAAWWRSTCAAATGLFGLTLVQHLF